MFNDFLIKPFLKSITNDLNFFTVFLLSYLIAKFAKGIKVNHSKIIKKIYEKISFTQTPKLGLVEFRFDKSYTFLPKGRISALFF